MWLQELLIKNTEQKEGEFEIPRSFLTLDSFLTKRRLIFGRNVCK